MEVKNSAGSFVKLSSLSFGGPTRCLSQPNRTPKMPRNYQSTSGRCRSLWKGWF